MRLKTCLFAVLISVALCQADEGLFYDIPSDSEVSQEASWNYKEKSNICYCDLTQGACDIDCDCDPECASFNMTKIKEFYNFTFSKNQLARSSECYSLEGPLLHSVSEKIYGLKVDHRDDRRRVCVSVANKDYKETYEVPDFTVLEEEEKKEESKKTNPLDLLDGYQLSQTISTSELFSKLF